MLPPDARSAGAVGCPGTCHDGQMRRSLVTVAGLFVSATLVLTACSDDSDPGSSPNRSPATGAPGTPTADPSATPSAAPPTRPPHPVSLPALFEKTYNGGDLRLMSEQASTDAYRQYSVTYRSGAERISGLLNVPRGRGPHPALVLAHGYIDPAVYRNGQGMRREQDWLARAGYVVLHTDYRNHAGSTDDPDAELDMRLGYTEDVINAVQALRRTKQVPVADGRVGLVGRSMGGGVVYNALAVRPGFVDAAVVFAPVSSLARDNFNRWIRPDPGRSPLADQLIREHGDPNAGGRFWREVSPRAYFDRISEPVLIHHGTSDDSCPIRWSRQTTRALKAAGVDVRLAVYQGEEHAFIPQWPLAMRRTTAFLDQHLT